MRLVSILRPLVASIALAGLWAPIARADAIRTIGRPFEAVPQSADVVPGATVGLLTIAQVDFRSEFEDERGDMSRARSWTLVEVVRPLDAKWTVTFEAELEFDFYRIGDSQKIVPGSGRLLDVGVRTHLEPGIDWRLHRDWKFGVDVAFETICEPGATLADSYTIGGSFYVWHRFSPALALSFGLSLFANLDDSPLIIPFVAPDDIDATSQSQWRFEGRGTGGRLGYAFTPTMTAGVSGVYDRRDWRLASDNRVPEGIARDIRVTLGLFAEVSPRKGFTFGLDVGMTVYHEFEIADRNADSIARVDGSPAAYVAFSLAWRF